MLTATPIFDPKYNLLFFGGIYVNSDLAPISYQLDFKYRPSYLWALGLNRKINKKYSIFDFEVETLLGLHSGYMNHWEGVVLGIARVNDIFGFPISFAVGEGQSLASQNPKLENLKKGFDRGRFNLDDIESKPWLNYLMFEMDYSFRSVAYESRIFVRIHHRSGIYGVYCPPHPPCGSNFLVYGFKLSF